MWRELGSCACLRRNVATNLTKDRFSNPEPLEGTVLSRLCTLKLLQLWPWQMLARLTCSAFATYSDVLRCLEVLNFHRLKLDPDTTPSW